MASMDQGEKVSGQRRRHRHPYLDGNFAPMHRIRGLTPCRVEGTIPAPLAGGQYVRNGGNPLTNQDLGRDAHWFDGDGMLSGVYFRPADGGSGSGAAAVRAEFVNRFVLTDVFLSALSTPSLQRPLLPSIATLVDPLASLLLLLASVVRTLALVLLSRLWGSAQAIGRISVANTAVLYHDGRALATCESGPPMRVALPELDTVGWFDGRRAEGEPEPEPGPEPGGGAGQGPRDVFGGGAGLAGFMREWTTGHPRVDPVSGELILFHSTFLAPYVHYSIVPPGGRQPRLNRPVPGVGSAKMMHDFGVSSAHTIILDLPLSLDPLRLARNEPVVSYDGDAPARFGLFPRYRPEAVRWFETAACCIFHTANAWDETVATAAGGRRATAVNLLACRLTSASLVFAAGDLAGPRPRPSARAGPAQDEEQCRLYYYRFDLDAEPGPAISQQWALSPIAFEFPTLRREVSMSAARFVYGCSSSSNFGAALGRAAKIDALVKMDVQRLIRRGLESPPTAVVGCVDGRSLAEVSRSRAADDAIKVFRLPAGHYAQEAQFVPRQARAAGSALAADDDEDDGWLLSYVFDESQLDPHGHAPETARSELWIIDARSMAQVVARVVLPQRVPYGLHGSWFSAEQLRSQRPVQRLRRLPTPAPAAAAKAADQPAAPWLESGSRAAWMVVRAWLLEMLA